MNLEEVKPYLKHYLKNGDQKHFKYHGKIIKGFIFTREQLSGLIDTSKHLYAMWGVKDEVLDSEEHLSLIIGAVATDKLPDLPGDLLTDKFEINLEVYTEKIESHGRIKRYHKSMSLSDGEPLTPFQLETMLKDFETAETKHLYGEEGTEYNEANKVKGYHLEPDDIDALKLRETISTANKNDEFIIMPVIRSEKLTDTDNTQYRNSFVSIAIATFKNRKIGDIREYCLPCPTACPKKEDDLYI